MFTGIVEGLGKILQLNRKQQEIMLRIQPQFNVSQYNQGESIAINGVCLTVIGFNKNWFETYVSPETFSKTNLAFFKIGGIINLERALLVGSRLGGHFVAGHVDTMAQLIRAEKSGNSKRLTFSIDKKYNDLLVEKGSITLDGISLTINDCEAQSFTVNIIPETQKSTTIFQWHPGYRANVEIDLISKQIQKFLNNFDLLKQNENLKKQLKENDF